MKDLLIILLLVGLIAFTAANNLLPKKELNYTGEFSLFKISPVECSRWHCTETALYFQGEVDQTPVQFGLNTSDLLRCGYPLNIKMGQTINLSGAFKLKRFLDDSLIFYSVKTTEIDNVKKSTCQIRSYR